MSEQNYFEPTVVDTSYVDTTYFEAPYNILPWQNQNQTSHCEGETLTCIVNETSCINESSNIISEASNIISDIGPTDKRIKNLVIGGGGIWIYAYAGAVDDMFTDEELKDVKNFIGSSAGAIMSLLLSCGASKSYIMKKINTFDLKTLQDHSYFTAINIYNIVNYFGYNKGDVALNWLKNTIEELSDDKDLTFSRHYAKYGTNLIVTGCNVTKNSFRFFNRLSDPAMRIADAIRISMSIPFFFKPFTYEGDLYVDGGTTFNYPISFISTDLFKLLNCYDPNIIGPTDPSSRVNHDTAVRNLYDMSSDTDLVNPIFDAYILNRTVGIKSFSKRSLNYIHPGPTIDDEKSFNIVTFIEAIVNMSTDATLREYVHEKMWNKTIKIDSSPYSFANFDLTKDDVQAIINIGRNSSRKYRGIIDNDISLSSRSSTFVRNFLSNSENNINTNDEVFARPFYELSLSNITEESLNFNSDSKLYDDLSDESLDESHDEPSTTKVSEKFNGIKWFWEALTTRISQFVHWIRGI